MNYITYAKANQFAVKKKDAFQMVYLRAKALFILRCTVYFCRLYDLIDPKLLKKTVQFAILIQLDIRSKNIGDNHAD